MHLGARGQWHGQQPVSGTADPGVVKQDKSPRGSVDTTNTRAGPQRVRLSSGERPIGAATRQTIRYRGLVPPPPPPTTLNPPHTARRHAHPQPAPHGRQPGRTARQTTGTRNRNQPPKPATKIHNQNPPPKPAPETCHPLDALALARGLDVTGAVIACVRS